MDEQEKPKPKVDCVKPIDDIKLDVKTLLDEVRTLREDVKELKKHLIKDRIDLLIEDMEECEPVSKGWFF